MTPINIVIMQGCIGTEPMMNLSGRLAFKMAQTVRFFSSDGKQKEETTWYHVTAPAESSLVRSLRCGQTVLVQGDLRIRKKSKEGLVVQIPVINADSVNILKTTNTDKENES